MKKDQITKWAQLSLRTGLAFAFAYAAASSFYAPADWIGFFPQFLFDVLPAGILLPIFSAYELALAAWLLSNKKTFYAAGLSALTLAGIVAFNFGALDIVFRDVGLLFTAIALAMLNYNGR